MSIAPVRESKGEVVRPQTLGVKPGKEEWKKWKGEGDKQMFIYSSIDFILIRNQPRGPTPGSDKRNVLFGLMTAGVCLQ